jgi:hypothetical protein
MTSPLNQCVIQINDVNNMVEGNNCPVIREINQTDTNSVGTIIDVPAFICHISLSLYFATICAKINTRLYFRKIIGAMDFEVELGEGPC